MLVNSVLLAALMASSPSAAAIQKDLDAFLKPLISANEFAGNIIVRRKGATVFHKSYGYANIEHQVRNGPQTKFLIGSISKQFTAAAILVLEQEGKLKIADKLSKYVPDFPSGEKIDLLQLMTHKSGIGRDLEDAEYRDYHTTEQMVELIKKRPLAFEPGTKTIYSNNAFRILAYVIEKVSGSSYEKFLTEKFFKPLGMHNTGIMDNKTIIPNLAVGYGPWFGGIGKVEPHSDLSNGCGPGNIYSTVGDLVIWNESFIAKGRIYPEVQKKMVSGNGIGVIVQEDEGRKIIWHNGVFEGYTAFSEYFPADETVIVYLGNIETVASEMPLQNAVNAIAFGEKYAAFVPRPLGGDPPAGTASQFVGVYDFFPGLSVTVQLYGDRLVLGQSGFQPLEYLGSDKFFFRNKYADVAFKRDSSGKVVGMSWTDPSGTYEAKRAGG